jgi:hypothetical protein
MMPLLQQRYTLFVDKKEARHETHSIFSYPDYHAFISLRCPAPGAAKCNAAAA